MAASLSLLAWTEELDESQLTDPVQRLDRLGYYELWLPERKGREPFSTSGYLLAKTSSLCVSPGIANVYARDAEAIAQGRQTLGATQSGSGRARSTSMRSPSAA